MKEYKVTLNMISDTSLTEDKIRAILNETKTVVSQRQIKDGILWSVGSSLCKDEPILEHIKELSCLFHLELLSSNTSLFKKIYLDIAVLYDTYTCSLSLPKSCIDTIAYNFPFVDLEISCYPTDSEA